MTLGLSLTCLQCGDMYTVATPEAVCKSCGGILEYKLTGNEKPRFNGPITFWKYKPVLPKMTRTVSLGEGGTPLQKAGRLAESLGVNNLWLKNETRNPTNSFKDRSAALIISDAFSRGYDNIICATNGNHGASISAYAARVDLNCNLIVPKAVDLGKLAQMMIYDAKIVEAGNTIEEAIERARKMESEMGWYQATTELNPLATEGLKTISYELVEQNGVPDWIIIAMGSGATLHAVWKGFNEMQQLGIIDHKPHLIGVQAKGCSPITQAFLDGTEKPVKTGKGDTEASAIRVSEPIYGELALQALKDSNGLAVSISDEDMIQAGKEIARYEGIFAEPASAAPVACIKTNEVKEVIGKDDNVVCLVTSSGLKTDDILSSLTKHKKAPRLGSRLATKERILRIISEEPTHGYAIWKNLGSEMTRGAVYQHLNDLENRGLISSTTSGKRKLLEITERGRRVIEALEDLQVLL
ncbi:MAG: threonine synthase [Candidatus Bathyarchaeota archaeon]|nr:threonine synthase [Candidatus Bathyarchaeota archaeon]